jgi:hypothetical protein
MRITRFTSPIIRINYWNTPTVPDKIIKDRTIIGRIHKTVTKKDFAHRHFFQRNCHLTDMYVRPAYKRAEGKTRITNIKMYFATGPTPDNPVTVLLTTLSARRINIFQ